MILTLKEKIYIGLVCGLTALVLGLGGGLGWMIWGRKPKMVMEKPQAAIVHQDGAVTLAVAPDPNAKPAQPLSDLPKGARVERLVKVVVQPTATLPVQPLTHLPATPTTQTTPDTPCPPVEVDLTLVKLADNSHRVITSSPSGRILDTSIDVPVEPVDAPPRVYNWTAGISYNITDKVGGIWIDRKLWRVTVGAELNQVKQTLALGAPTTCAISIRVGWQF